MGVNAELSGPLAFYGESLQQGVQAYVDTVNDDGGIDGHPIELTSLDNAGDAARSATNATQLATSEGVNAMFGFVLSANCSSATPVVERHRVPLACLSVAEPNDYVYSLGPNNTSAAGALLEAAKELSGTDTPSTALVHLNTLTVLAMVDEIEAQAGDAGVDLTTVQELDIAATDVSAQVAKVVQADPDVVIVSNFGPGFLSVLEGLRSSRLDVPVIWVDGTGNLTSLQESDDDNVYAFTTYELVDPESAEGAAAEYVEAVEPLLEATDAVTLNAGYTVMGYLTARAFGEALASCGHPCSGEDLKTELDAQEVDFDGLVDGFAYSEDGHYPYPDWHLFKVVGTEYEQVASFESQ
ncbi:ABC transporter substrate-binding protein [Nocardioides sp. TF02-7]|uniref:ABC transporter substrate-binding protein n=1 Tax=Nocardioides sp. TF02-7 TaxID=2917724 RepID=UPI001F059E83|nr:ABC transporter substrate-binding protein [Nocardioides sp. TF02-7]UMG91306.1 ABC transporter substrate-binding protein [Nocardioides sp. TF02-7]